jgi:riboflavin kinase/FMN adenylyltransferase
MLIETDYRALAHAGKDGLPLNLCGAVVVIGNFDGVHRGHQALLAEGKALGAPLDAKLVVLTFAPHPRRFFKPDQPPFRLSDNVLRAEALMQAGADGIVVLKFDAILAQVPAKDFVETILLRALQAKHVVVGNNFVFGHKRGGDTELLQKMGRELGFGVTALPVIAEEGARLSSQSVRDAIQKGRMAAAENILGRPWEIRGTVIRGDQRGRTIGFPTANMSLGEFQHPAYGVYAVQVTVEGGGTYKGVANIGIKPSFGLHAPLLEAHLFDFNGDLYGKTLRVALREFLRPEEKFGGLDALKEQIALDAARAREILARLS